MTQFSNRGNAKKNTTSTRFNATQHGLRAAGLTELDEAEGYSSTLRDLNREKNPVGTVENFLLESIALNMTRMRRVWRLEAEHITAELNPPVHEAGILPDLSVFEQGPMVDPGLPATMRWDSVHKLVTFQRYGCGYSREFHRDLHELERQQRMRLGERVPAPAMLDVNIHAAPRGADSLTESADKDDLEGSPQKLPDKNRGGQ